MSHQLLGSERLQGRLISSRKRRRGARRRVAWLLERLEDRGIAGSLLFSPLAPLAGAMASSLLDSSKATTGMASASRSVEAAPALEDQPLPIHVVPPRVGRLMDAPDGSRPPSSPPLPVVWDAIAPATDELGPLSVDASPAMSSSQASNSLGGSAGGGLGAGGPLPGQTTDPSNFAAPSLSTGPDSTFMPASAVANNGLPASVGNSAFVEVSAPPAGSGDVQPESTVLGLDSFESPGGPALAFSQGLDGAITIPCPGTNGLTGWTIIESGGSLGGKGGVTVEGDDLVLREGDSFLVGLRREITIPSDPSFLTFNYHNLVFDTTDATFINDAFEVALVDGDGLPLIPIFEPGRDAALNITEGEEEALGQGTTDEAGAVALDISQLAPGSTAHLVLRLVNDDSDTGTTVRIGCAQPVDNTPVVQVPGDPGELVVVTLSMTDVNMEAAYKNELGLYLVQGADGRVGGLLPSDPGYAHAALTSPSRQVVFPRFSEVGAVFQITVPAGSRIAFYLVQNDTTDSALLNNPHDLRSLAPHTFFSYSAPNPDAPFQHFRKTTLGDGSIQYEVEDLTDGGDQDYNDLVFTIEATETIVPGPVKFHTVDAASDASFRYNPSGDWVGQAYLASSNTEPRGITSNAAGDTLWAVDANQSIYVYSGTGGGVALGSWDGIGLQRPEGIATDGANLWIVDADADAVSFYAAGAARRSGAAAASSTFSLHAENADPTGLTTDGATLWVTDEVRNEVFVYSTAGAFLGRWGLDAANAAPSGIANDPTGASNDLWVVDRDDAVVYRYASATGLRGGGVQTAADTFTLAGPNVRPEGIADPGSPPTATDDSYSTLHDRTLYIPDYYTSFSGVLDNDSDPDGDPLTALLVSGPQHGSLTLNPNGSFQYTPAAGYVGSDSFTYKASDGSLSSNTATVTIQVTNTAPVASNDAYNVIHDRTLYAPDYYTSSGVLDNDWDPDYDPMMGMGDTLTAILVSGPQHGSLTLNPDGKFQYLPNPGYVGPDGFTYQASDGIALSNVATAAIQVTNRAPTANNDSYSVKKNETLVTSAYYYVYGRESVVHNDYDPDGDDPMMGESEEILTAILVSGPQYGTLRLRADGGFEYTPNPDYVGLDGFTYKAFDGAAESANVATVAIEVVDPDPAAVNDAYSTPHGVTLVVRNTDPYYYGNDGVLLNDSEPEGGEPYPGYGSLQAVLVDGPRHGILTLDGNGALEYVPDAGFVGIDAFTYRARYGALWSNIATVTIQVTNQAPTVANDAFTIGNDAILTVAASGLLANDSDPDGDSLTAILVDPVTCGALSFTGDGAFVFTPQPGFVGIARFTYKVSDGAAESDPATVTITVTDGGTTSPGPDVTAITATAPGTRFLAGAEVLVSGRVTAEGRVEAIMVNGAAVEAVDAGLRFFSRVLVRPGRNVFTFVARGACGQEVSATLELEGYQVEGPIDHTILRDASASIVGDYHRTSFNDQRDRLHVELGIRNVGQYALGAPLLVGIVNISEPMVRVADPDRVTPDGIPYYDYSKLVGGGALAPGGSTGTRVISFLNPRGERFTYDLVVLGVLNRPPAFVTPPIVEAAAGGTYEYDADAVDLDADALTYTLVVGPETMSVQNWTGLVAWSPTVGDVGNHDVIIRVTDGRGGSDLQRYVLTVTDGLPNRPPHFTSDPVVDARVNTAYAYQATAVDPDLDPLSFTLVSGPTGLYVSGEGLVTWTPGSGQVGEHEVTLRVTDGRGGEDTQTYTILVRMEEGNHPPIIVSTPPEFLTAPPSDFGLGLRSDEVFIVPGTPGEPVAVTFEITGRSTIYYNEFGIYKVLDAYGRVGDFIPGDPGYARAALDPANSQVIFRSDQLVGAQAPVTLIAGELVAFYLIQNNTTANFRLNNPDNKQGYGPYAFFPFPAANPDLFDHLRAEPNPTAGLTQFSFEDLTGGGDQDFDDIVYTIDIALEAVSGGMVYSYPVRAVDPDGDALTYHLTVAPDGASINEQTGLITWTATPGTHLFTVVADDGRGGRSVPQSWTLEVEASGPAAIYGVAYDDRDGDGVRDAAEPGLAGALVFLDENDNGQLDPGERSTVTDHNGRYAFTALAAGEHVVVSPIPAGWVGTVPANGRRVVTLASTDFVVGIDFGGRKDVPSAENHAPEFVTLATLGAAVGEEYRHQARATDPDHDVLIYDLPVHPDGMVALPDTGLVVWIPTADQVGVHDVLLRVRDGRGGVDLQPFRVTVAPPNAYPVITSRPYGPAAVGVSYHYDVIAQDPDGDPLQLQLIEAPAGMTIVDGWRISWPSPSPLGGAPRVKLAVSDGRGGEVHQWFDLPIAADPGNRGPEIVSTPRTATRLGLTYIHQVRATDPDQDDLTFSLPTKPTGMVIDPRTGVITWDPLETQFGPGHDVTIRVDDGRGEFAELSFQVDVRAQGRNEAPTITSTPPLATTRDRPYLYRATAEDPDGDPVIWSLDVKPAGMMIDQESGVVSWTPTIDQIGEHEIIVRARDVWGASSAPQSFTIIVRGVNLPPRITSDPVTVAAASVTYTHAVRAVDPEDDPLRFRLMVAPPGMTIDSNNGLIRWTPAPTQLGAFDVTVRVEDGQGGADELKYRIDVRSAAENREPIFDSDPGLTAIVGQTYRYTPIATDPDGDAVTLSLPNPLTGVTMTGGEITWTPTSGGPSWVQITVAAYDALGAGVFQTFIVTARDNHAPTLNAPPAISIVAGQTFHYDARATDLDGDVLTYALIGAPDGMEIDAVGRIAWLTKIPDIGSRVITIKVTDPYGASDQKPLALTVTADSDAPRLAIVSDVGPGAADLGSRVTYWVDAVDNVGVESLTLTVDGVKVPLDGRGRATVVMDRAGDIVVSATATDTVGNTSATSMTVQVIDPLVTSRPTATILSPVDSLVTVITTPTPIHFTATDANLSSYALAYAPLDTNDWTILDAGSTSVTNRVVTFDPTLLANGAYRLRLTARNTGGVEAPPDERILSVEGNLKLGNLKMSFNDMTIPVAGVPITITRTYDSLNAKTDGDFGHGWSLEETGFQVRISQSDGTMAFADPHQPFHQDTRISITRPGHEEEIFVFRPESQRGGYFSSPYFYKPHFERVSGTSELSVSDIDLIREGDSYFTFDFTPYNPADSVANPSRAYTLKTRDGSVYVFDAATGRIATITDRVGRELYFEDDGIRASDGRGVAFVRDPRTNRITKIIDEQTGREITYGYDAAGDLKTVAVPFDGAQTSATEFVYDSGRPHFLKEVIDPLGRTAATTHYDAEGRVERVVDADGKQTLYQWDAGALVQQVTDQLGYTTELTLDDRGNVLRVVDPEGGITKRTHDGDNHLLSETIVVGLDDSTSGETDDLTTTYTYVNGNLATVTDSRGNTTYHTYNAFGQPTGMGAADGGTSSGYDQYGLLRWTRDLNDNLTSFDYDSRGNLTAVRNGDGQTLVTSTYNAYGEITSTTPAAGRATHLDYAAGGEVVGRWWFDGEGPNKVQVLDATRYNDAGQVVETVHAVLPVGEFLTGGLESAAIPPQYIQWTTAATYNQAGQVLTQTDQLGRMTEYVYDKRGQEIQVRSQSADEEGNPVWLVTRVVYDAAGQVVASTDPYVEGSPTAEITGVRTQYDKVGRVTLTERRRGLRVDLTGSGALQQTAVGDLGALVADSGTTHDNAGRVVSSVDADGLETRHVYNRFGETVETRTRAYDQDDQPVWLVTRTVYDDRGRAVFTTDAYVEGSTDPVQGSETIYDDQGRAHRSIRRTGVQVDLNLVTRATTLTNAGSELWRTETVFDSKGRVQRTIGADGQTTDYEYDDLGRRVAVIGPAVEIDGQTIRHRTETVHDDLGRVWKERTGIRQLADGSKDYADVRETTHAYDAAGNLVLTTFADNTTISATYDDLGRKTSETNQLGLTRDFEYDAAGRLAAVELPAVADPLNGDAPTRPRYEYGHDAQGNQTLIRDPLGRETRFTYDAQGRQLTRVLPLGFGPDGIRGTADDGNLPEGDFSERFEYDDRGRQTLHVSFEGVVAQSVYDSRGRLSQQRFFPSEAAYNGGAGTPSEIWNYTYDAFGRVIEVEQDRGGVVRLTTTTYDAEGRVGRIDSPEGAVNYRYDSLGRRVRALTGAGSNPVDDTHYAYDGLGRLASVAVVARDGLALTGPEITAYAYDLLGNLAREDRPDGTIVVYQYDEMNRLTELTQYAPDSTPENLADNPKLAEFAYDLNADGSRREAVETFWFDANAHTSTTTWTYDDLGRLVDEAIDHYDDLFDQTERFAYDLTGNRLRRLLDRGGDGTATPDEVTVYGYDANDRLKTEALDTTGDGVADQTTTYGYDHTQQTLKEVHAAGVIQSRTAFAYDLQGRMAVVTATTHAGGVASHVERTSYEYGPDGIRVGALNEVDANADGTYETATKTEYLNDPNNPTGYSQVLKETTTDLATGQVQKTIVYAIGHAVVSQTTTEYSGGLPGASSTLVLGRDGHGSTRLLTDLAGAIATFAGSHQVFDYTAYGELLNLDATLAATSLLYSGEMFDAKIGLQYLRARWYDPNTGRFNRLDPFFGNLQDPQSLHKYLYTHGDPINGIDPTGWFSLGGMLSSLAIGLTLHAIPGPGDFILSSLETLVTAYSVNLEWDVEWALDWELPDDMHSRNDNTWVAAALLSGFRDAYRVGIPFTDIGFNPLDIIASIDPTVTLNAAGVPKRSPGIKKIIAGGHAMDFSSTRVLKDKSGKSYTINLFKLKGEGRAAVVFPRDAIKKEVRIIPNGPGDANRRLDIKAANEKFDKAANYDWSDEFGEPHTWHHDTRKGIMQLVPRAIHVKVGHIGGHKLWYP